MAIMSMGRLATSYRQERRLLRRPAHVVGCIVALAVLVAVPSALEDRALFGYAFSEVQLLGIGLPQVNLALIAVMGAIALNLLVGHAGLISLGHGAFFAVGAFAAGLFGTQWGLPFPLVLVLAGIVGAAVGVVVGLPSLRLQGLYLMLATLALHFIVVYLFLQYQLKNFGPAGIPYEAPSLGPWVIDGEKTWYYFFLAAAVVLMLGIRNLLRTRQGRSFVAVRDHETAAASMGVNVQMVRLKAFAVSSFIVSAVGAAYAYYLGNVADGIFTLNFVIGYFAMVIIGGMGSTTGATLGAVVWMLLPQVLQTASRQVSPDTPVLGTWLTTYQGQIVSILLGVLVLLILRFRPEGLNGFWQAARRGIRRWPYGS